VANQGRTGKAGRGTAKPRPAPRKRRSDGPPVWLFVALGVVVVAAIAFFVYVNQAPSPSSASGGKRVPISAGTAQNVGEQVPLQTGTHIQPPQRATYASDPPTSGQHYSIFGQAPLSWGYNDRAVPPEYWVHNLEHGGVVVLYSCPSGCSADQAQIKSFIDGAPAEANFGEVKMTSAEYAVPGHRFALVAWGWRLFMDTWDPAQAEKFYEAHVDHGPELIP
jgi:hypothetical protein